jgi:NADH-quinone oxidoreductase subunit L
MRRSTVLQVLYNKYYVDEAYDTIFVKTTNGLSRFFRDHVETTLSSLVLIRESNQRNRLSRKKNTNRKHWFLSFCICLGLCAILTYLFINNFIL